MLVVAHGAKPACSPADDGGEKGKVAGWTSAHWRSAWPEGSPPPPLRLVTVDDRDDRPLALAT